MTDKTMPAPRYSLWQAIAVCRSLATRALQEVRAMPIPKDGADGTGIADAFIGRGGELVLIFTDGRVKNLGAGFAKDLNADAIRGMVSEAAADMWKGIWEPRTYKRGDWITHGGSLFIAVTDTAPGDRPMDSEAWKIALRRGRDGKDAPPAKASRPSLALPEPAK